MSLFITPEDFEEGKLHISSTCYEEGALQACIDKQEEDVLQELLGCELYNLLIADWDGNTPGQFSDQRFIDIFDKFCEDIDCGIVKSQGIKDMLMNFIYFEYIRIQAFQNRTTGNKKTKSENSERASFNDVALYNNYNDGVHTYCAIQWFICKNSSDYIEYNGIPRELLGWL